MLLRLHLQLLEQFIRKASAKGVRRFLVSAPLYDHPYSHIGLFDYFDQLIKQVNQSNWQLFIHQLGGKNHKQSQQDGKQNIHPPEQTARLKQLA
jgi:hypothetical protein